MGNVIYAKNVRSEVKEMETKGSEKKELRTKPSVLANESWTRNEGVNRTEFKEMKMIKCEKGKEMCETLNKEHKIGNQEETVINLEMQKLKTKLLFETCKLLKRKKSSELENSRRLVFLSRSHFPFRPEFLHIVRSKKVYHFACMKHHEKSEINYTRSS